MPKTVKIFISSTFRDMNAERDVLIKNVFPRLREKAEEIGLFIREVDLRWGVTEEQAKLGEALEICLDGIEECRPYFLCMLGKRYGWIPAPNFIRVADFDEIVTKDKLSAEEIELVKSSYHKASDQERVYTLNHSLPNEIKDRLQQILENAGLPEAMESITEKEIRHAVLNKNIPRSIPELKSLLESLPPEKQLTSDENALLRKNYVRTEGAAIWRLLPGVTENEQAQLKQILEKLNFQIGVHSFFYFREDVNEDHPDFTETDQKAIDRLKKLKQAIMISDDPEIKPESENDFYHCTWHPENIGKESEPIQDLQEFEERVFNDLLTHIQQNDELQVDENKDKTELEKEMDFHYRFIDSRTYNFHGREELLKELEGKIDLALKGQLFLNKKDFEGNPVRTQHIMVVGEPGSGKSALLAKLYQNLVSRKDTDKLIIPLFIGAAPRSVNPRYILTDFCQRLINEFDIKEDVKDDQGNVTGEQTPEIPTDFNKLQEQFRTFLHDYTGKRPVIFVIDAINQLQKEENAREMNWLPDDLPANVCIVTSLVEDKREKKDEFDIEADTTALDSMRKRFRCPYEIPVSKLSEAEQKEIIDNYLGLFNKKLPDKYLQLLTEKQEAYNPLFLTVALEELRIFSKHEELENFIESVIPDKVIDIFDAVLARVEKDIASRFKELSNRNLFVEFMKFIACGRNGTTEEDLRLLMGEWQKVSTCDTPGLTKKEAQLSDFYWGELKRSIRSYLFSRGNDWDFFHQQLKQAVAIRYLQEHQTRHETQKTIADYLELMGYEHLTTIKDLPHHLVKIEDWDRVENTLCDLLFIEARVQAKLVYDLISDYQEVLNALPEYQGEKIKEQKHQDRLDKYTRDLIAYSKGEIDQLDIIPSVRIWTDEEINAECERMTNTPTRLDRIRIFSRFVNNQSHVFTKPWITQNITIQQAYNSAKNGPVADAASKLVGQIKDCPMILNAPPIYLFKPQPALQKTLEGHTGEIGALAMTSDGKRIISASWDKTLRVWDLKTGECLRTLKGHRNYVVAVAVTPDGKRAVSGGVDQNLCVWDLKTGECLRALVGHFSCVVAVAVTPDGRRAVSGSRDNSIRIWDLETGECLKTLEGHSVDINAVAVILDGRKAISGGSDKILQVWDLESDEYLRTLEGHTSKVSAVAVTPDGRIVVSGSWDKTLRIWDLETGECSRTLEGHTDLVNAVAVTPDGKIAVSGSSDKTLCVWDLESGECLKTLDGHTGEVKSVAVTPNGRRVVSGSYDGPLRVWNIDTGECSEIQAKRESSVDAVAITLGGRRAISGSKDKTIRVWNIDSGECSGRLTGHTHFVKAVAVTSDGRMAVSGSADKTLRIWDLKTGECSRTLEEHTNQVWAVAITSDGRRAVSGSWDMTLRIWDLKTGECLGTFEGHTGYVSAVAVTPDGKRAVSGSRDNTLRIWDLETSECLETFEGHTAMVSAVAVTPDGRRAVSSSRDNTLRVWELESGKCLRMIEGLTSTVVAVAVTPDGRMAVSGSGKVFNRDDNALRVWDLETGECLFTHPKSDSVTSVSAVTPDGRFACGTKGGTVNFFKIVNCS